MGLISKVVLVCITLVGLLLGNMGFRGDSPEGIAVGILGVLIALIALTFLLKFLWRFLGCLSTILIALVLVIILLILTGTFDKVTDMIKGLFSGNGAQTSIQETSASSVADQSSLSDAPEFIAVVNEDGTMGLVPIPQKETTPLQQAKAGKGNFQGKVTAIRSGNQFIMDDLEVILYGIDAPDPKQVCSDKRGRPYNCGQEAIRQFRRFTGGSLLSCKVMSRSQRENVVYAVCNIDNKDIGMAMVSSGWAFALPNVTNVYEPYESVANASRAGMWSGQFYKPAEWRAREAAAEKSSKKSSSFFGGLF